MLSSLEIKNFRTFSHLVIERLGRVNLIVGKNNVGKTSLLEALRILGSASPLTVRSILEDRNEVRQSADLGTSGLPIPHFLLESLLHGRELLRDDEFRISVPTSDGQRHEAVGEMVPDRSALWELRMEFPGQLWFLRANGSSHAEYLDLELSLSAPVETPFLRGNCTGREIENLVVSWWDVCWPSGKGEGVLKVLSMLAPIEDIIFVSDPRRPNDRIPMARVAGFADPLPLAAVGDGLQRLFHIALAMEYAAHRAEKITQASSRPRDVSAFLLIDEVETGIHHTLHADLWRFVFKTAELLDVQVFATTHSWDCVKGFQEALVTKDENDGMVIRLEEIEGEDRTGAVVIDPEDLPIVVRESIEVR